MNKPLISVITATYNAGADLPNLIASLRAQTSKKFEWIIADGLSTDDTLAVLEEVSDLDIQISSQHDFGIYDALNRAIKLASGKYYVVIGADDLFYEDAIENILKELSGEDLDILVGHVESDNRLIKIYHGKQFLYGARALVTSHSVGCVFNKQLHEKYGYYTNAYSILADSYFIKKIFSDKCLRSKYTNKVFGNFSTGGISKNNALKTQCEFGHIQLTTEPFKPIQSVLFFLRILKELFKGNVS